MTLKTKGYVAIVEEYQETGQERLVDDMVDYLERTIYQLTNINYKRVRGYGYTKSEVHSLVLEMVWIAMEEFDGSKGSDFLAYYRQRVHWKVNDELIEKRGSLADPMYISSQSLDVHIDDMEQESMDSTVFNNQDNQELSYNDEDILKVEYLMTYRKLLGEYIDQGNALGGQAKIAVANDKTVLETVFQAVEDNVSSDSEINDRLYAIYPNIKCGTIRRRKWYALDRFGKFIKESSTQS